MKSLEEIEELLPEIDKTHDTTSIQVLEGYRQLMSSTANGDKLTMLAAVMAVNPALERRAFGAGDDVLDGTPVPDRDAVDSVIERAGLGGQNG